MKHELKVKQCFSLGKIHTESSQQYGLFSVVICASSMSSLSFSSLHSSSALSISSRSGHLSPPSSSTTLTSLSLLSLFRAIHHQHIVAQLDRYLSTLSNLKLFVGALLRRLKTDHHAQRIVLTKHKLWNRVPFLTE